MQICKPPVATHQQLHNLHRHRLGHRLLVSKITATLFLPGDLFIKPSPFWSVLQFSGGRQFTSGFQSFRIYVHYIHEVFLSCVNTLTICLNDRENRDPFVPLLVFCSLLPSVTSVQCEATETNRLPHSKSYFPTSVTKLAI